MKVAVWQDEATERYHGMIDPTLAGIDLAAWGVTGKPIELGPSDSASALGAQIEDAFVKANVPLTRVKLEWFGRKPRNFDGIAALTTTKR